MLVKGQQCATELAAELATVAGEVPVVGLHMAEHQVAPAVAIVAVQTTPVLPHRTPEHSQFNT
jgi:hypothetical protein